MICCYIDIDLFVSSLLCHCKITAYIGDNKQILISS